MLAPILSGLWPFKSTDELKCYDSDDLKDWLRAGLTRPCKPETPRYPLHVDAFNDKITAAVSGRTLPVIMSQCGGCVLI